MASRNPRCKKCDSPLEPMESIAHSDPEPAYMCPECDKWLDYAGVGCLIFITIVVVLSAIVIEYGNF